MLHILNSKQTNSVYDMFSKQWGIVSKVEGVFLKHDDGRVYLMSKDLGRVDLDKLRVNSLGLYIGEVSNGEVRLSIEGSLIFGPYAKKNVCEIDSELKQWIKGEDISVNGEFQGFVIVKHGDDFIGCGKFKNGKILNFVPKARRLQTVVS